MMGADTAGVARSVTQHFDQFAAEYNQSAEWCTDHVLTENLTAGVRGRTVLDLGCGTGLLLNAIRSAAGEGWGLDVSLAMLREGAAANGGRTLQAEAEHLPFLPRSFDVVICRQLLHYTREAEVLTGLTRVLRPGGELRLAQVTSLGRSDFAFWTVLKAVVQPLRRRYYTPDFLASLVTLCGFELVDVSRHRVRRRYAMDELFRRSPMDAAGRARVQGWMRKQLTELTAELRPEWSENELVIDQHWTLLVARLAVTGQNR